MVQPSINTGTSLNSVASSIADPMERSIIQKMEKSDSEQKNQVDKGIAKIEAEPKPRPPIMTQGPDVKDYQSDPWNSFGSGAGFLATFGSLLTRRPLTNALNAGAAVMTAANNKDANNFKAAFDKWKLESENAWKMADWDLDQYKTALGKDEDELKTYISAHKNETAGLALQARMSEQNIKAMRDNLKKSQGAQGAIVDYVDAKEQDAKEQGMSDADVDKNRVKWFGEALQASKGNSTTGDKIDFSSLKPEDQVPGTGLTLGALDQKVEGIKNGASYSNVGLSMRTSKNPSKDAVDDRLHEKYPDFDYTKAQLERGEKIKELASNAARTAMAKTAVKEMDRLSKPMIDAMKKLNPSDYPDWNSVKNSYDRKTGGPDVVRAFQAVQDFRIAFDTLMTKSGASTDASREVTSKIADINFSLDQIEAVRDQAIISGAAILDAVEDVKRGIINGKETSPSSGNSGGEAPEGTVIHNGDVTKIKKNGKWVTQ